MADDDGDAPKKVQVDPAEVLSAWFKARVVSSFKCKPEQADTMINNETSRVAIDTFFNNETCQRLLVFASPDLTAVRATRTPGSGVRRGRPDPPDLTTIFFFFFRSCPVRTCARAGSPTSTSHRALTHPTIDSLSSQAINPPDKFRKKTLCFLKLSETEISPDNVDAQVIYGDFGDVPLEHLSVLAQEVFLPMLTNPRNQVGWPEVITKEVVENLHKFIANVYVTIGQTKGKTLLPLPPSESDGPGQEGAGTSDKDQIHVLESAIVTWTRQIKGVLKTDPEAALKEGSHPGPLTELEFWEDKAANLNAIHEQLSGEKIRKVVKVLEMTKSSYFPAFQRLCEEVAHARVEANDNVLFLKPLDKYFQKLNLADEFPQLAELFKPIMHVVLLVWKHSHHYNTPGRIVVLVREICNDLIMQSQKFVQGEEIFNMEPPEAVSKLQTTLKVCGTFKSHYFDYKSKTNAETPQNPWRFQNSALFARLDSFLERCHDILDLTQTVLQFNKLERVEVGGTKGKALTASVQQVFVDFQEAVEKFHSIEYDIMDVE